MAITRANAGPQQGERPLPPALRDVLVAGLPDGRIAIVARAPADRPRVLPLLSRGAPDVTADDYAIVGRVRYGGATDAHDMDGVGYLQMWSEFPDGGRYSTRTLADDGPLQKLSGHSDGRPFRLPFHAAGQRPIRLALDVVLPGRASVTLSDVRLVQDEPASTGQQATDPDVDRLRAEEADLSHDLYAARLPLTDPDRLEMAGKLTAVRERLRRPTSTAAGRALDTELNAVRTRLADPRVGRPRPAHPTVWTAASAAATAAGLLVCGVAGFLAIGRGWWAAARAVWTAVAVASFGLAMAVVGGGGADAAVGSALLLACSAVATAGPILGPVLGRRRRDAELRRMRAIDGVTA